MNATIGELIIPGSPFAAEVYDITRIKVTGLKKGVIGKPYDFGSRFNLQVNFLQFLN